MLDFAIDRVMSFYSRHYDDGGQCVSFSSLNKNIFMIFKTTDI